MESLNFKLDWIDSPLAKLQVKLSDMLSKKYQYLMMRNTEQSENEEHDGDAVEIDKMKVSKRKIKIKGAKKPKSKSLSRSESVERAVPFPERPALKFIPSPEMSHQLIVQAMIESDPGFYS